MEDGASVVVGGGGCHFAGEELEDVLRIAVQQVGDFFEVGYGGSHANHGDEQSRQFEAFPFEGAFRDLGLRAFQQFTVVVVQLGDPAIRKRNIVLNSYCRKKEKGAS